MTKLFLDIIVTPMQRFLWSGRWKIPAALAVIAIALVVAILVRRKSKANRQNRKEDT